MRRYDRPATQIQTFVRESANLWTSSFDPTATNLSPSIAMLVQPDPMRPFVRTRR